LQEGERRLAAIMFTDIVGYTAITQKDEKMALSLLEKHRDLIRPVVSRYGGREVKTMGDAFLIEFPSALNATESAVEIQKVLGDYNKNASEQLLVKIGIHVGDVVHSGADVFGDAVNIASRIQSLADGGGVCISEQVYAQVRNKVPYRMEQLPAHELKNVQYPVDVYRLTMTMDENPSQASPRNRVAVLPLSNISPDSRDGYFADGMTEELITVLSQVHGLRVIARTSVDHFRGRVQRAAQIGRELGVGSMIEGSVRIAGDRLRVTIQLIDASNEEHLWSENYDRRLDDIFEVQSDIARRVAKNLEVRLMAKDEDRLSRRQETNMNVYRDYLKGRLLLAKREKSEMWEAKKLFEKAIDADPTYAPAFAGLADAYFLLGDYWAMPTDEARAKSNEMLSQALKLDPSLAEARATHGLSLARLYRYKEADAEFRHAIDLNPSNAIAHMWYSQCLGAMRRYDEGLEQLRIAEQLDPLSPVVLYNQVFVLTLMGEKELAWEKLQRLSELDSNPVSQLEATWIFYHHTGQPQKALEEFNKHPEVHDNFNVMCSMAASYAKTGDKASAKALLEKMLNAPDTTAHKAEYVAFTYLELGDYDNFFAWMNRSVDLNEARFGDVELFPSMKPVLSDPRWKALQKRVNLDRD